VIRPYGSIKNRSMEVDNISYINAVGIIFPNKGLLILEIISSFQYFDIDEFHIYRRCAAICMICIVVNKTALYIRRDAGILDLRSTATTTGGNHPLVLQQGCIDGVLATTNGLMKPVPWLLQPGLVPG